MSSNSRKAREKPAPAVPEVGAIDSFEPDYGAVCRVCGESPCVIGLKDGIVAYESEMCGRCVFGSIDAMDPAHW